MENKKDPFKTDKPLYDYSIEYDYSSLPKCLIELIKELEGYDKEGDWFNYDIKFSILDVEAKSYLINGVINEYDYKTILEKYGGLYD